MLEVIEEGSIKLIMKMLTLLVGVATITIIIITEEDHIPEEDSDLVVEAEVVVE